jgi:hypothetical protein
MNRERHVGHSAYAPTALIAVLAKRVTTYIKAQMALAPVTPPGTERLRRLVDTSSQ